MKKLVLLVVLLFPVMSALIAQDKWENSCRAYFASREELSQNLIELIESEQEMIQVAVQKLTNRSILKALIKAKARGVSVEVIVDSLGKGKPKALYELIKAEIPVYVYSPKDGHDKTHMRNKFFLFTKNRKDEKLIWSGTFDFTYQSKQDSRENVLLLSIEDVVKKYESEFEMLKNEQCIQFSETMTGCDLIGNTTG